MIPLLDIDAGPIYGLSSNVVTPPLSMAISIALIFGVDSLGLATLKLLKLEDFAGNRWLRWQATPIGAAVLTLFLYPLALAGHLPRFNAQVVAIGLAIAGTIHGGHLFYRQGRDAYREAKTLISCGTTVSAMRVVFWLILVGFGLLALGPITEADSLDYHAGVALSILNTGSFPYSPEWFHSRLAGSGEILIVLGLSLGAEQFGSLLQFSGVIGVVGIFRHGFVATERWRLICLLSVVSTPIFVAWVASPKPLLLPIAMTTAALMLSIVAFVSMGNYFDSLRQRNVFALICLLVMTAAVTKMNFMLSGAAVGMIAFSLMVRRGNLAAALTVGIMMATLIMAPPFAWKHAHYGGGIVSGLITPFPGNWPGTNEFETLLRAYRDTTVIFPISLLIPSGVGTVTTVLGLGLVTAFAALIRPRSNVAKALVIGALVVAVLAALLGQKNARFFMEPYLWLIMAAMLQNQSPANTFQRVISAGLLAQGVLVIAMITIGIATLTTGALSPALREATMARHAMSYSEMRWVDSVLPPNAKLIVNFRFMALAPRFAVSSDWRSYGAVENGGQRIYEKLTSEKGPEFILLHTIPGEQPRMDGCNGEIYAGPFHAKVATRNPFNSGAPYDAWVIRLSRPGAGCEV